MASINIDDLPDAVCILDAETLSVKLSNRRFRQSISSIATGLPFLDNFIGKEDSARFGNALISVKSNCGASTDASISHLIVRDCETLTSASRYCELVIVNSQIGACSIFHNDRTDYPIWRKYDWALSSSLSTSIILSGRPVSDLTAEKLASEKVLVYCIYTTIS